MKIAKRNKCRFAKKCDLYREGSRVCIKQGKRFHIWFSNCGLYESFKSEENRGKGLFKKTRAKRREKRIKDCSTCGYDRTLFEGPGCWRIKYYDYRSLNELTEKEKQECHLYKENPDCTQCSLYYPNWKSSWCDYFDVSCAETAVLTHPAATGNWGCLHWISKFAKKKPKVNSKANQDAANKKVDEVIKNIKD